MSESPSPSSRLDPEALKEAVEALDRVRPADDRWRSEVAVEAVVSTYLSALPTEASELEELRVVVSDLVEASERIGDSMLLHQDDPILEAAKSALSSTREPEHEPGEEG